MRCCHLILVYEHKLLFKLWIHVFGFIQVTCNYWKWIVSKKITQLSTSTFSDSSETKPKKKSLYDDNYLKFIICFETLAAVEPMSNLNEKALLASSRVAFRVVKAGKLHTIAENVIFHVALDIPEIMFGKQEVAQKYTSLNAG